VTKLLTVHKIHAMLQVLSYSDKWASTDTLS